MKKLMIILLAIAFCSNNIECKPKKINKVNEFLKGTLALTATGGLLYLAYQDQPINLMQKECKKAKDSIDSKDLNNASDAAGKYFKSCWNWAASKINLKKELNKNKIFSLALMVPAYELFKYGVVKLAKSFDSKEYECEEKEHNS